MLNATKLELDYGIPSIQLLLFRHNAKYPFFDKGNKGDIAKNWFAPFVAFWNVWAEPPDTLVLAVDLQSSHGNGKHWEMGRLSEVLLNATP